MRVVTELEAESSERNVSLNVITKQILEKHLQWHRFADKMDILPVPSAILRTLSKNLEMDDIFKLVDEIHNLIKKEVMFAKGKYDLRRCVEALEDYMKSSGLKSEHRIEGSLQHFIIQHELGMKWSLLIEQLLKKIFHEFLPAKDLKFQTSDSILVATIALGADFDEHAY